MELKVIDWLIIAVYAAFMVAIAVAFRKRAGRSLADFFVSGRSLPWWIAGTSMVATTFAADTPLAVTGLTVEHGLAGNWFWWSMAFGGMITVFVYARLWRRSQVLTDAELVEQRYGGKPASALRGFRAIYFALPINCIIMGWVTAAMVTILRGTVLHGMEESATQLWMIIFALLLVVGVISTMAGMYGVAITDFVQFIVAMGGCIALAVLAVRKVGGMDALREQVIANAPQGENALRFFPVFRGDGSIADLTLGVFLIFFFVTWWATWYPGAEPGGGGYVVQRMASCRSERDSLLATLWFQVAHYCVRPWPWLIVAFVAIAWYPELQTASNKGVGFPDVMREVLPVGLRGLLLVAFFSAFLSTLSTQINWGASYLVNDVYKRFIDPAAEGPQLANAGRLATVLILVAGGATGFFMVESGFGVDRAWKFLAALGAGTGSVYMVRWFWWRVNAWSEISAMVSALVYFVLILVLGPKVADVQLGETTLGDILGNQAYQMAIVAALTIVTWVAVTFLTQPESNEKLVSFYRAIRPGGPGWGPIAKLAPDVERDKGLGLSLLCAAFGCGIVLFTLPAIGSLLFGDYLKSLALFAGTAVCAGVVIALVKKLGWAAVTR